MAASRRLIERSGALKRALLELAREPRFSRAFKAAFAARFGKKIVGDEADVGNFLDHFILQRRLPDGRTVVEYFVESHPELPAAERAMLLGWRDVVEGIFAVERREGDTLIVTNLIDELTYRVHSNMGPGVFKKAPAGSFLVGRLVPVDDEWLISGFVATYPASARDDLYRVAAETSLKHPEMVFRNPRKLEQALDLQREEHRGFVAYFGTDVLVLPGREVARRMREYMRHQIFEVRDEAGQTMADRARQELGFEPAVPEFEPPEGLQRAPSVGIIFDEVEGLNFYRDLGPVVETFERPELASDRRHREAVLLYLKEPRIEPLPLRRLAERDPERASRVFQQVLRQPDFSWARDGENLLRRYKAEYFNRPPRPGTIPLSDTLARAYRQAKAA